MPFLISSNSTSWAELCFRTRGSERRWEMQCCNTAMSYWSTPADRSVVCSMARTASKRITAVTLLWQFRSSLEWNNNWGGPKIGVPLNHPFCGIVHCKPSSSYWDTNILGNPQLLNASWEDFGRKRRHAEKARFLGWEISCFKSLVQDGAGLYFGKPVQSWQATKRHECHLVAFADALQFGARREDSTCQDTKNVIIPKYGWVRKPYPAPFKSNLQDTTVRWPITKRQQQNMNEYGHFFIMYLFVFVGCSRWFFPAEIHRLPLGP